MPDYKNLQLNLKYIDSEMTDEEKVNIYNENLKLIIENLRIIDYNIREV